MEEKKIELKEEKLEIKVLDKGIEAEPSKGERFVCCWGFLMPLR